MPIFLHILRIANRILSSKLQLICAKPAEMSPVNATLQKMMCMFSKITYNIQVENRIRIFVRKVSVDKTLWPGKPKEREGELSLSFGGGWKIRLKEIECGLDESTCVNVQLWSFYEQ